mgnify:CR=1 FL=1
MGLKGGGFYALSMDRDCHHRESEPAIVGPRGMYHLDRDGSWTGSVLSAMLSEWTLQLDLQLTKGGEAMRSAKDTYIDLMTQGWDPRDIDDTLLCEMMDAEREGLEWQHERELEQLEERQHSEVYLLEGGE